MKLRTALIGLFGVITIVGGYLIIDYVRKNRKAPKGDKEKDVVDKLEDEYEQTEEQIENSANDTQVYDDTGYPISKGSYGDAVEILQKGLIEVYGAANILKVYGADGDWGTETQAALVNKGWATTYNSLDEIKAEIKKHKPSSVVASIINTVTADVQTPLPTITTSTKMILVGAGSTGTLLFSGASPSSSQIKFYSAGDYVGVVVDSTYTAAASSKYVAIKFAYNVFGYARKSNLVAKKYGTYNEILAWVKANMATNSKLLKFAQFFNSGYWK